MDNIITCTDSYKLGHWEMYPEGTELVYSYFEARNGARFDKTVFFGLQYLLKQIAGVVVTKEKIKEAAELVKFHMGTDKNFNYNMWNTIADEHGGKLPVIIKAVPEGTAVDNSNVLMTVENTCPKCAALTNHLETFLTHVWYSSTVATMSYEMKKMFKYYMKNSSDNTNTDFMLHDFGFRGVSSLESAGIGGSAHLLSFRGTDTIAALETAIKYYGADSSKLGFSVPASEHSIMTSLGRSGEKEIVQRLINKFPSGILSVVADSYNIENFVTNIMEELKQDILNRDGVFVVRPDSLRDKYDTPEDQMLWLSKKLAGIFGFTVNSKNKKILNPKVKLIWGDGIDKNGIDKILNKCVYNDMFSAENYVFGMGGGLLQKVNRDTQRFAFKCSAQRQNGVWKDIFKDPLDSSKTSKKGKLKLIRNAFNFLTPNINDEAYPEKDLLVTVFKDGNIVKEYTFEECRENLNHYL